jgi:hypothetical protein
VPITAILTGQADNILGKSNFMGIVDSYMALAGSMLPQNPATKFFKYLPFLAFSENFP